MIKTFIVGDLHIRKEQPFMKASIRILDILSEAVKENDRLIFLGDFFHTSRPYPEELNLAKKFFDTCKASITILAGNHEYLEARDSFSEYAFGEGEFKFIDFPTEVHDIDCDYLFLPWVSGYRASLRGFKDMREFYADWLSNWTPKYPDSDKPLYVLYHFEDETVFAGVDEVGVDLSVIDSKVAGRKVIRIGGHIHNPNNPNYLGTPYMTRKDDANGLRKFYYLEKGLEETFHKVEIPSIIEYDTLDYEELNTFIFEENKNYIISVVSVPSSESLFEWKKNHNNIWIDDYTLKFGEERTVIKEDKSQAESIREFLELFIKQNKVDSATANYLLSVF